jgi:predicted dehydrogenase
MATLSAPVRVLVAGAGAFGREHLDRLVRRPDVSVVGVADTNPAALAPLRSKIGAIECLTDPLQLIDKVEADTIIVATPADSHVEICTRALGRNLAVLLEKPAAPSASAAVPLLAAERKSAGFVLPGHVLRFSQDHIRMIEIIRSGGIGEVIYVNSRRYRDDEHAVRYPHTDPVLMTLIHDIDLAQWITGSDFRSGLARRSGGPGYRSMTAVSATSVTGVTCDLRTAWTFAGGDLPPDRVEWLEIAAASSFLSGTPSTSTQRGSWRHIPRRRPMILYEMSRTIFSRASVIACRRRRLIWSKRSPD